MNRYLSTQALVINKKSYRESDLLVTLLTPEMGKIKALAKGAKNLRSSRLSSLQLGNLIQVSLYNKNNFLWLSESKNLDPFLQKKKSLSQLGMLFYFLEALNSLLAENQIQEHIFEITTQAIKAINQNMLVSFIKKEMEFLETLGFGVPAHIKTSFDSSDFISSQRYLKEYFESITEKHFQSNKLFK